MNRRTYPSRDIPDGRSRFGIDAQLMDAGWTLCDGRSVGLEYAVEDSALNSCSGAVS